MFSEEQMQTKVTIDVRSLFVGIQVVDAGLARGIFRGNEMSAVGQARDGFVSAIRDVLNIDYDQALAALIAQRQAQAAKAAPAAAKEEPKND